MRRHPTRWIPLLGVILVAASCGGSDGESATTTADPSTTQTTTTTTTAPPATTTSPSTTAATVAAADIELPGPGEPWDLVFFGFDDVFTEAVAELYTDLAAEALGVDVTLSRPAGFDHVYASTLLAQLRGDRYPPLGEMVPPAEIIVFLSRPGESIGGADEYIDEDFRRCWWRAPEGNPPTTDLPDDYWDIYRSDLQQVYAELWNLRQGTSTVLITIDLYNPSLPAQVDSGIADACTAWFEAWDEIVAEEAEANGAVFVSLQDLFNGLDHDLDPAASGYIGPTADDEFRSWYQATPEGASLIARALAEAGFEPTSPAD